MLMLLAAYGCANPCLQLIAIAASTEVYSFNSELNRAQTSNLNLNQTGTGKSESSYLPKGENCLPPLHLALPATLLPKTRKQVVSGQ